MDAEQQPDFDWVAARRACQPAVVFEGLAQQARRNVEAMREEAGGRVRARFELSYYGTEFVVFDHAHPARKVTVRLLDASIEARQFGLAAGVDRVATLTLDDAGQCRLNVDGVALQPWQFLRRVLEPLFFESE